MKVGLNLPVMVPGLGRDLVRDWCRRVDAGPYSSIAAGERITFPNPEIMVTLSHAAAWTERVSVGFHVLVPPMHDAVLLAKQVATLDILSGGRVCLGVGVGAREEDYRAVGAKWDLKLLSRLEKGVRTMQAVWDGTHVVENATRPVEPLPLQAGGPPLLAGVLMPQAIARVAKWADGITGFSFGPSREDAKWRWITPGSLFAALTWLLLTWAFGIYVGRFTNYHASYGSLGAVVALLSWMYLSAYAFIFGAELNSEIEHQTAKDSTTGSPEPMGTRGAWAADNVATDDTVQDRPEEKREGERLTQAAPKIADEKG